MNTLSFFPSLHIDEVFALLRSLNVIMAEVYDGKILGIWLYIFAKSFVYGHLRGDMSVLFCHLSNL